jgi:hypothetical protein
MTHFILIFTAVQRVLCFTKQQMLKLLFRYMPQAVANFMSSNGLRGYKMQLMNTQKDFSVEQLFIHMENDNTKSHNQSNISTYYT